MLNTQHSTAFFDKLSAGRRHVFAIVKCQIYCRHRGDSEDITAELSSACHSSYESLFDFFDVSAKHNSHATGGCASTGVFFLFVKIRKKKKLALVAHPFSLLV